MKLHQENIEISIKNSVRNKAIYQVKNWFIDQTFDAKEAIDALHRLVAFAQNNGGSGSYVIQCFLVGLYNGVFRFDLTDFRRLDHRNFEDCMKVLRLDQPPFLWCEVHQYFENGSQIFEQFKANISKK